MPTFKRVNGIRFFVYSNDHEPMHVHAEYAGRVAKITLAPIIVEYDGGLPSSDIGHIVRTALQCEQELINAWHKWYASRPEP